ncbi:MAG: hypothetical protein E6Q37_04135 [Crocinitomicaceae bacterium]|jgi:hypothetical protein|nr:MAG: hypothetical protein E6Q37_04135 [Crocinitomicaceae bacterium]
MKSIFTSSFLVIAIAVSGMLLTTSCRKKKDTIAKIYVRDASNSPVAGCQVVLKGVSTTNNPGSVELYDTTETNASGEAIFNFNDEYKLGQAGVAVLNIEAEKDALFGTGIIKIEEEVTNEETVFVQ